MSKKIETLLRKALLQGGKMAQGLYEYELEEHIDYWYKGLKADREAFVFAVTENSGEVAMVLITKAKEVYVNEAARDKLKELWPETYDANLNYFLPMMVQDLMEDTIAVTGVKVVEDSKIRRKWTIPNT